MRLILVATLITVVFSSCQSQQNPVVVELFTSQGCSSCPAADRNLTAILDKAKKEGIPVLGLSFHVDYWNHIGWKDPYSAKIFTERQRSYVEAMGLSSLYTPQMIVNGAAEFVGSDKNASDREVQRALKQVPKYHITINHLSDTDGVLEVQYTLDRDPETGEVINAAIVEKNLTNFVSRGENSGKTLHHDNVVRHFATYPLKQNGAIRLKVPSLNRDNTAVILYIQDAAMQVEGAVRGTMTGE